MQCPVDYRFEFRRNETAKLLEIEYAFSIHQTTHYCDILDTIAVTVYSQYSSKVQLVGVEHSSSQSPIAVAIELT